MVHPALLRTTATLGYMAGRSSQSGSGRGAKEHARRLLRRLNFWMASDYRPELHYMRGGRTAGAKSHAAG